MFFLFTNVCKPKCTTASAGGNISIIGGLLEGNKKSDWCCSVFSNVCAPCDNPANAFTYLSPSPCSNTASYQDIAVRCMDPTCNKLTKGSYDIQLCRVNGSSPWFLPPDERVIGCGSACDITGIGKNQCRASQVITYVLQQPLFIRIRPSGTEFNDPEGDTPNAPFEANWSGIVLNCDN